MFITKDMSNLPSRTLIISNIINDDDAVDIVNTLIALNINKGQHQELEKSSKKEKEDTGLCSNPPTLTLPEVTSLKIITKNSKNTGFIECTDVNESIPLKTLLHENDISCRFANYKLYMKISSSTSLPLSFGEQKKIISEHLQSLFPMINIIYFKVSTNGEGENGNKNGILVVDRLCDMKRLVKYSWSDDKISCSLDYFRKTR